MKFTVTWTETWQRTATIDEPDWALGGRIGHPAPWTDAELVAYAQDDYDDDPGDSWIRQVGNLDPLHAEFDRLDVETAEATS